MDLKPLAEEVSPRVGWSTGQDVGFGQVLHHLWGWGGRISGVESSFLVCGERGRFSYHLGFGLTQAGVVTQAGICLPKLREGVIQKASPDPQPLPVQTAL